MLEEMNTGFGMSAPHSLATSGAVALVPLRICPHNHRVRPHTTRPLLELWHWCRYVSAHTTTELRPTQLGHCWSCGVGAVTYLHAHTTTGLGPTQLGHCWSCGVGAIMYLTLHILNCRCPKSLFQKLIQTTD